MPSRNGSKSAHRTVMSPNPLAPNMPQQGQLALTWLIGLAPGAGLGNDAPGSAFRREQAQEGNRMRTTMLVLAAASLAAPAMEAPAGARGYYQGKVWRDSN